MIEPRPRFHEQDRLIDLLLGLRAASLRLRETLEAVAPPAPPREEEDDGPEVKLLLGLLSVCGKLDALFPGEAPAPVAVPAPTSGGSLLR